MFDMGYMMMVMLPGMVLSGAASMMVKKTFSKYETVGTVKKLMLERAGVTDCRIEPIAGRLSDHYDPRDKTLRLSEPVYNARSISAIGVACHEAGHALLVVVFGTSTGHACDAGRRRTVCCSGGFFSSDIAGGVGRKCQSQNCDG